MGRVGFLQVIQRISCGFEVTIINLVDPYPDLVQGGCIVNQIHSPDRVQGEDAKKPYENF